MNGAGLLAVRDERRQGRDGMCLVPIFPALARSGMFG